MIATTAFALALLAQAATKPDPIGEWKLNGSALEFALEATGRATDPKGATLSLRSISKSARNGSSVTARLPAEKCRGMRVTLSGELLAQSGKGAFLFVSASDASDRATTLQNSLYDPVLPEDGWGKRSVSLPVPEDATGLTLGLVLQGEGSLSARTVRLEIGERVAGRPVSESAKKVLDEAISLVRESILPFNPIDWKVLAAKVRALGGGAQELSDTYPVIRWLLSETGDRKSYFVPAPGVKAFWGSSGPARLPVARALDDGVSYLSASGHSVGDLSATRQYAKDVRARLVSIAPSTRCGMVVDLRENTGGDTGPLAAGLGPLFSRQPAESTPGENLKGLDAVRVAVLTGAGTPSSVLTNAFRRRAQTRTLGQPTAVDPKAFAVLALSDGSTIILTAATTPDATGRRLSAKIEPDEIIAAGRTLFDSDPTLSAAVSWLKQSPTCGGAR